MHSITKHKSVTFCFFLLLCFFTFLHSANTQGESRKGIEEHEFVAANLKFRENLRRLYVKDENLKKNVINDYNISKEGNKNYSSNIFVRNFNAGIIVGAGRAISDIMIKKSLNTIWNSIVTLVVESKKFTKRILENYTTFKNPNKQFKVWFEDILNFLSKDNEDKQKLSDLVKQDFFEICKDTWKEIPVNPKKNEKLVLQEILNRFYDTIQNKFPSEEVIQKKMKKLANNIELIYSSDDDYRSADKPTIKIKKN